MKFPRTRSLAVGLSLASCLLSDKPPLGRPITIVHAQTATLETRLKAAFLSKFPQFVEWPAETLAGRTTIEICVASPNPFGSELDELVAGESLNGRRIVIGVVEREQDVAGCHILFLPARPDGARHPLLRRAESLPILTVGDTPRFLDEGGIVRLRTVDGRLRFDVNAGAAQRVGLRISAQLLRLALSVRGGAA